jgi:hypothetical protein
MSDRFIAPGIKPANEFPEPVRNRFSGMWYKIMSRKRNTEIKKWITALFVVTVVQCLLPVACKIDDPGLMIGLAEVNYTPPVGLDLVGNYRGDDYASRGVHDSLYAKAIVFENSRHQKAAILTMDICKIPYETIAMMRETIAASTGISPGNIMIHATHTHSGPRSEPDAPMAGQYMIKAASAVILANRNLKPGQISAGRSRESGVSFNRRLACKDGKTHMSWEKLDPAFVIKPLGPVDPELITVWIHQGGRTSGAIVNFGCHPTTLTGNNWLYSADYPGYLADTIRKVHGDDFVSLFFNGCCGNVTQVNYKTGFIDTYDECRRIGHILGGCALQTFDCRLDSEGDEISVMREMVPVKRVTITEEQYHWAKEVMKKVEKEGMPKFQPDGIPDAQFAKQWIELYKVQNQVDSLEVMVIRVGNVAFVGLPGEMFNEFGSEIKNKSPFRNTLVMGQTNDARKYFPTLESFSQGPPGYTPMITGYETTPGATLYEQGAGERLTRAAIELLHRTK